MKEELYRVEVLRDEINKTLADVTQLANTYRENGQLRTLLEAIVASTEKGCRTSDPNGRYVKSGGGWRRLPDGLGKLINQADDVVNRR
jgi:hypothetical protein